MRDRMMVQRKKAATPTSTLSIFKSSTRSFTPQPTATSQAPTYAALISHNFSNLTLSRPQAKLTVSQPDDPYEQEADRVAEQVMRITVSEPAVSTEGQPEPAVQRKCSACGAEEELLSRKEGLDINQLMRNEDTQATEDSQSENVSVSLASDQEVDDLGHSWVITHMPDGSEDSYGFWPKDFSILGDLALGWYSGRVMHPDTIHKPNAVFTAKTTPERLQNGIEYANSKVNSSYHLFLFNCSTFARSMFEIATGQTAPSGGLIFDSPSALAMEIERKNAALGLDRTENPNKNPAPVPGVFPPSSPPLAIQRQCAGSRGEEEAVQMKLSLQKAADSSFQASSDIESQLSRSKGGGNPLPDEVRSFMEPRFGFNFQDVRVHTDSEAIQMNRELSAQAFTHGNHIYFGAGKSPAISDLTAHELTHVVQQTGGVQTKPLPAVQLKCSTCEAEDQEIQRSLDLSTASQFLIQGFWDDEEEVESEDGSNGGVFDWASEQVGEVTDWATETGGTVVDWVTETGGEVVDNFTDLGGDAVDWVTDTGSAIGQQEQDVDGAEDKRSSVLAQISALEQQLAGRKVVYLTESELTSLNQYCATIRERLPGRVGLPNVATASVLAEANTDVLPFLPIAIPKIAELLASLAAAIAALTLGEILIILAVIVAFITFLILLFSDKTGRYTYPKKKEDEQKVSEETKREKDPKNPKTIDPTFPDITDDIDDKPPREVILYLPSVKGKHLSIYEGIAKERRLIHIKNRPERNTAQADDWDNEIKASIRPEVLEDGYARKLPNERIFRPNWSREQSRVEMQVDHKVELQVTPPHEIAIWDYVSNYELLDKDSNEVSGRQIRLNIIEERKSLARETNDPSWLTRDLIFDRVVLQGGQPGQRWVEEEILEGDQITSYDKHFLY